MKISRLEVEGFQRFRDRTDLDLSNVNLAAVVGLNRAGKSTIIMDAVLFALYGKSRSATIDDVMTRGVKSTTVRLTFTHAGSTYRVTRMRGGGTSSVLERWDGTAFVPVSSSKHKDADAQIIDLLGMNYTTSLLTWAISQGESGRFAAMDPAPRRKELALAFGLGDYTEFHKRAKKLAESERTAISVAQSQVAALRERITATQQRLAAMPADLENQVARAEREYNQALKTSGMSATQATRARDNLVQSHERAMALYTSARDAYEEKRAGYNEARLTIESMTSQYGSPDHLRERIAKGRSVTDTLATKHSEALRLGRELDARITTVRDDLNAVQHLSNGACPTCHQHVSADLARSMAESLTATIATLRERIEVGDTVVSKLDANLTDARRRLEALEADLEVWRDAHETAQSLAPQVTSGFDVEQPVLDENQIAMLQRVIDGGGADADDAKSRLNAVLAMLGERSTLTDALARDQAEEGTRQGELDRHKAQATAYTELAEAFHESGIPTMILRGIVTEINTRAAEMLRLMGGGDLGVNLTLETGKLMIEAIQGTERVGYKSLSGSEKLRIDLALRLSIMLALTARHGHAGIETIIMDEGWGTLDAPTLSTLVDALTHLSATFDVYTISHIRDVQGAFGVQIQVVNDGRTSHARVVATT